MLLPVGNIPLKVSYDQAIGILLKDTRIFILLVSFFFFYQNLNSSKTLILPQSLCNIKLVINWYVPMYKECKDKVRKILKSLKSISVIKEVLVVLPHT